MMDFKAWEAMILHVVVQISDGEYQRLSWFGKGEFISSPDELYSGLFDDAMIEEFLETYGEELTEDQNQAGKELVRQMSQYAALTPENLDPAEVIDDPRWQDIRELASSFLTAMKADSR
jgi:hypothetical protein